MSSERSTYEICVEGHLDERWVPWFERFTFVHSFSQDGTPVTKLFGSIVDQAALHGVLNKLRDIGISIRSINRIESGEGEDR